MNKKILAISILMLMACTMVAFAQNADANALARDAQGAVQRASNARRNALASSDPVQVLRQADIIMENHGRVARQFNNLINRGVEISDFNARNISRDLERMDSYFHAVRHHHGRLLMR